MSQEKKNIPFWAKTGHAKPITRREMLASGLIPFSASMLMPNWMKLLQIHRAEAATVCPTPSSDLMPFITLNLAGGAGMAGNFVPVDAGGQMLPSYNLLGLGKTPPVEKEFGNVPFGGMNNGALISKFLQGLRETAPTALAKTAFVGVCVRLRDDTSENKLAADGMLAKAGLAGTLLPNLGRRANSAAGIGQEPASVSPPAPLIVGSFNTLTNSLGYAAAVGNALKPAQKESLAKLINRLSESQTRKLASMGDAKTLIDCAGIKNQDLIKQGTGAVDPRKDAAAGAQISTIWNINAGTGAGSQDLIFSSMAYNALMGQCGSVALELGGYDYHDNSRTSGDQKDLEAGRNVGRILETASALNKPVFLYVTTDGAVVSQASDTQGAGWTSDRGTGGMSFILHFHPSGRPATSGFQIGSFTSGQVADDAFVIGNSPEAAASAVFANYLAANKRLDLYTAAAGRALDARDLDKVLKFA